MSSGNIKIPYEKPAIIYFEWENIIRYHLEDLINYEIRKYVFKNTYEQNKSHFFTYHPVKFVIYSNKGFSKNQIYTPNTIATELKQLDYFREEISFLENFK